MANIDMHSSLTGRGRYSKETLRCKQFSYPFVKCRAIINGVENVTVHKQL